MRDSNSRGVAPNTLSNNADQCSSQSGTVRRQLTYRVVATDERPRTRVNETRFETSGCSGFRRRYLDVLRDERDESHVAQPPDKRSYRTTRPRYEPPAQTYSPRSIISENRERPRLTATAGCCPLHLVPSRSLPADGG